METGRKNERGGGVKYGRCLEIWEEKCLRGNGGEVRVNEECCKMEGDGMKWRGGVKGGGSEKMEEGEGFTLCLKKKLIISVQNVSFLWMKNCALLMI